MMNGYPIESNGPPLGAPHFGPGDNYGEIMFVQGPIQDGLVCIYVEDVDTPEQLNPIWLTVEDYYALMSQQIATYDHEENAETPQSNYIDLWSSKPRPHSRRSHRSHSRHHNPSAWEESASGPQEFKEVYAWICGCKQLEKPELPGVVFYSRCGTSDCEINWGDEDL